MKGARRCAILILAVVGPVMAQAQFQEPTPDELKMTSEPKAPGASAIYLYREEDAENDNSTYTRYARIKVLTEKGEDLATVRIPYVPGSATVKIDGRTIHPDGTVIPLTVKPQDLLDYKSKYFQEDMMVFTLPSVEVGSILEYRVAIQYGDILFSPTWEIQTAYFTRKAHFYYHPGASFAFDYQHDRQLDRLMWSITPSNSGITVQRVKDKFTVDMTDIPPDPDEDWMPPMNTLSERVEFYYTYAKTASEFWTDEQKGWAADTEDFIKQTGTIKKAAAGLVEATDSDDVKARKIYAAVMKIDNTDFSRVKSDAERKKDKLKEINHAEDVWKNQSGPGNSVALLYVALAQAAGLKAWPAQVVDRSRAFFDVEYLSLKQLDDYIAVVEIGGKDVFLDPGQRMCPFGALEWAHELAAGFRLSENGVVFGQTPGAVAKTNAMQRVANLTVDAQGHVSGIARYVMNGPEALYWRQVALENDATEVKKQFEESISADLPEGVQAEFDHFLALDDYESNLMAIVKVSGTIGTTTGKHFIIPGLFFESRAKHSFVSEAKRETPIDVHYTELDQDDVTYQLPEGFSVESTPKSADVTWPGYAALRIDSTVQDGALEVVRAVARNFVLLGPEKYTDLHDFYTKLAAADQQQIVLTRSDAAKGN